ncbi:MAG: HD domain-containing protein [Firmicutes bacterium]|nr:HD domain-containing protein [Bacillota bacterium]
MEQLPKRLRQQIDFALEIDKLKSIYRQNLVADGSRRENDAEHSWHLAVMAVLLAEYLPEPVDLLKVMKMVLLHDVVEIDAGDVFCYDPAAAVGKEEREQAAAERIYALLPTDQGQELKALWEEFEAGVTLEAKFAVCLDRMQPLLLNFVTQGGTWRIHNVSAPQVRQRMAPIREVSPELGEAVEQILQEAISRGILKE